MRDIGGREEEGVSHSLPLLTFILLELEMPKLPVKLSNYHCSSNAINKLEHRIWAREVPYGMYRESWIFPNGGEKYGALPFHV